MLASVMSYGLIGIKGFPVDVEIDLAKGQPGVEVVGLPDAAVKESQRRVQIAIKNSGLSFPLRRVTINLAPADLKKEGPLYDLPIAVGLLMASQQIPMINERCIFIGELSLNGDIRPVSGVLPMLIEARASGVRYAVVPKENEAEAVYINGMTIITPRSLRELVDHCKGTARMKPIKTIGYTPALADENNDFSLIRGQNGAKRAAEIAAAGGHNILFIGSPGSGKTMIARSIPGILPDMSFEEALTTTKIHSAAGELKRSGEGLIKTRPFRSPHHTASAAAIIGGGTKATPGEVSLAHNGVLFLDELPEFRRDVLESLRQPLEDGQVSITRIHARLTYPARFMLVAAMNPCPCGNFGAKDMECKCSEKQRVNYVRKISGPLLDRIDLHIGVDKPEYGELTSKHSDGESSASIKSRVNEARSRQLARYQDDGIHCNAELRGALIDRYCSINAQAAELLREAFFVLKLSARAYTRVLLVSRTIADLDGSALIEPRHIAEAIQYRTLDRKYWNPGD